MRTILLIALFAASVHPALADDRAVFYGKWGTEKQCLRKPIKPGGTRLAEPFEINGEWLRQGQLWCRLNWFPVEKREDGAFSGAYAQCGEDAVRGYPLGMVLAGDELTLRWDFPHKNGPLKQCR